MENDSAKRRPLRIDSVTMAARRALAHRVSLIYWHPQSAITPSGNVVRIRELNTIHPLVFAELFGGSVDLETRSALVVSYMQAAIDTNDLLVRLINAK